MGLEAPDIIKISQNAIKKNHSSHKEPEIALLSERKVVQLMPSEVSETIKQIGY